MKEHTYTAKSIIRRAFQDALPVMAGYFPIAMTFGILADSAGINAVDGVFISLFLYAGASQFMAVSMIASGMSAMGVILAVFFMNFRHFIMSASVRAKLKYTKRKYFPIIGFYLTDETYSVISMKDDVDDHKYLITLELSCHASWVGGTAAGYIFGLFIPSIITESMGIALYALLLTLLIPSCKKSIKALVVALASGMVNSLLLKFTGLDPGACFIGAVLIVASIATILTRDSDVEDDTKKKAVTADEH